MMISKINRIFMVGVIVVQRNGWNVLNCLLLTVWNWFQVNRVRDTNMVGDNAYWKLRMPLRNGEHDAKMNVLIKEQYICFPHNSHQPSRWISLLGKKINQLVLFNICAGRKALHLSVMKNVYVPNPLCCTISFPIKQAIASSSQVH